MSDTEITKRLPIIQGAGGTLEFRAIHKDGRAVGVMEARDGFGNATPVPMDARTIAETIKRLQELENLVRGMNEAKTIIVGVDQNSVPKSKWGKAGEC